jgi:peptidase S24-like protein
MTGAYIYHDEIIVIDRAITAANNRFVVARIGEEFTLKRLQLMKNRKIFLKPENPKYTAIEVTGRDDFEVWGVVTWVLHNLSEPELCRICPAQYKKEERIATLLFFVIYLSCGDLQPIHKSGLNLQQYQVWLSLLCPASQLCLYPVSHCVPNTGCI